MFSKQFRFCLFLALLAGATGAYHATSATRSARLVNDPCRLEAIRGYSATSPAGCWWPSSDECTEADIVGHVRDCKAGCDPDEANTCGTQTEGDILEWPEISFAETWGPGWSQVVQVNEKIWCLKTSKCKCIETEAGGKCGAYGGYYHVGDPDSEDWHTVVPWAICGLFEQGVIEITLRTKRKGFRP
jgi:hypothetical protein